MRFRVRHVTVYSYSRPVRLGPHWLRLRPRGGDAIEVDAFALDVDPRPAGRGECLDAEGNRVTRVWFGDETTQLAVTSRFDVTTCRDNPFDFLGDPAPFDAPYAPGLAARLAPWIRATPAVGAVRVLAAELRRESGDAYEYVHRINAWLFNWIRREIRDQGAPQPPEETLRLGSGACRDQTVLFVALCREVGLAARFVSGYQRGSSLPEVDEPGRPSRRHMHAWPEVYLPGGGWRGFDPTRGLAVADAHVALAAAADARDAAPVDGHFYGDAAATLRTELEIEVSE